MQVNPRLASIARGLVTRAAGVRASNPQNFLPMVGSFAARGIHIEALQPSDGFIRRHNSPMLGNETQEMVDTLGYKSIDELIDATVPKAIRKKWTQRSFRTRPVFHLSLFFYLAITGEDGPGQVHQTLHGERIPEDVQ
eukprot:4150548-Pyramimonas_sp.AAC.1